VVEIRDGHLVVNTFVSLTSTILSSWIPLPVCE
jgi:hypothetical protein